MVNYTRLYGPYNLQRYGGSGGIGTCTNFNGATSTIYLIDRGGPEVGFQFSTTTNVVTKTPVNAVDSYRLFSGSNDQILTFDALDNIQTITTCA